MTEQEFLKEEYQTLRREVEIRLGEVSAMERNCVFAVAACFVWFSTQPLSGVFAVAWFLPSALVGFCILRTWSLRRRLGLLSEYLFRIEGEMLPESRHCGGWEHFQNRMNPDRSHAVLRGDLGVISGVFWFGLMLISLLFGLFGFLA